MTAGLPYCQTYRGFVPGVPTPRLELEYARMACAVPIKAAKRTAKARRTGRRRYRGRHVSEALAGSRGPAGSRDFSRKGVVGASALGWASVARAGRRLGGERSPAEGSRVGLDERAETWLALLRGELGFTGRRGMLKEGEGPTGRLGLVWVSRSSVLGMEFSSVCCRGVCPSWAGRKGSILRSESCGCDCAPGPMVSTALHLSRTIHR